MGIWAVLFLWIVVVPFVVLVAGNEAKLRRRRTRVKRYGCDTYRTGGGAR